jgi:hypothetical protein
MKEILAFDEKIALAKLEEAKAEERVKELEYQKARFCLEYFLTNMKKENAQNQKEGNVEMQQPYNTLGYPKMELNVIEL